MCVKIFVVRFPDGLQTDQERKAGETRCGVTDRKWTARHGRSKGSTADKNERARQTCVEQRNSQRIGLDKKEKRNQL